MESKHYGKSCPICKTDWKQTPTGIGGTWYDCLKCGKKAEDIAKEVAEKEKKEQDKPKDPRNDWGGYGTLLEGDVTNAFDEWDVFLITRGKSEWKL